MWTFSSNFTIIYNIATTMNLTQYIWRHMADQEVISSGKSISSKLHPWLQGSQMLKVVSILKLFKIRSIQPGELLN